MKRQTLLFVFTALFLLFKPCKQVELLKKCPKVPGVREPINIIHTFFQAIFSAFDTRNDETDIKLVQFSEQLHEAVVYRYIFKYTGKHGKSYYLGVLSTIPGDKVDDPEPEHIVVRFIQSTDINDAKRLLGMYDEVEGGEEECGYKNSFWEYLERHPFEVEINNGFKGEGRVLVQQNTVNNKNPVAVDDNNNKTTHVKTITTVNHNMVDNQSNGNSGGGIDNTNFLALLDSLNTGAVDKPKQIHKEEMTLFDFPSINKQILPSDNNTHSSSGLGGGGGGMDLEALLKGLNNNSNGNSVTTTTTHVTKGPVTYSTKKRYTLGAVISGTGKDKIMNPKVINHSSHGNNSSSLDADISAILKSLSSLGVGR